MIINPLCHNDQIWCPFLPLARAAVWAEDTISERIYCVGVLMDISVASPQVEASGMKRYLRVTAHRAEAYIGGECSIYAYGAKGSDTKI